MKVAVENGRGRAEEEEEEEMFRRIVDFMDLTFSFPLLPTTCIVHFLSINQNINEQNKRNDILAL